MLLYCSEGPLSASNVVSYSAFKSAGIACLVIVGFFSLFPAGVIGAQLRLPLLDVVAHHALQDEGLPRTLDMGKPVDQELSKGERHSYQLSLKANEFVRIIVVQEGINVRIDLFKPDGLQISTTDSSNTTQGSEIILFVADVDGNYLLTVYSSDQQTISGRYEIRIQERHSALPQDRNRVMAFQSFAMGQRLFAQATAASLTEAINKFREALPFWRLLEDRKDEAVTLSQIARAYDLLGDKVRALDFYNQALPILQGIKDSAGEATTLNNIGLVYDSLGEKRKAMSFYDRALPVLRSIGEKRIEAYTMVNIGLTFDSLGEKQKALNNYKQALQMLQDLGDQRAQAATLNNIGFVYNSLGEKERALEFFTQALPLLRAVGDRRVEAITINNIGHVYESLEENEKALEFFTKSLPILRLVGERRVEAITLNNIGLVFTSLGDRQKALQYFNESLPIRRAVGDRQGEAITLSDLGYSHALSGDSRTALDFYNRALSLSREVEDQSLEASILRRIALVASENGDWTEARTRIEAAIEAIESLRVKIASQELRSSYFATAQQYFETYIDVLMQLHKQQPLEGFDGFALQASERARARSLLELLNEAGAGVREGVDPDLLERERTLQQVLNSKAAMQQRLMQGNHSQDELAKIRNDIKLLLEEYNDLQAKIRLSSPRYAALTQPSTLSLSEIQHRILDRNTVLLEYSLGTKRSYLWMLTSTSLTSVELPPRERIEEGARLVYRLLTERNRKVKFETAAERQTRIRAADEEFEKQARDLSQTLLGPVNRQLQLSDAKRMLVVSDGALNYLPFTSLPTPESQDPDQSSIPLVVNYEVVNLPSASILDVLRRETASRKPAPKTLAVLADPVFERGDAIRRRNNPRTRSIGTDSFSETTDRARNILQNASQAPSEVSGPIRIERLPFTRREAEEILSLVPKDQSLKALDFDANKSMATNPQLGHYRFVHFATHGVLDTNHPELSGIVLSLYDRQTRELDGFLRVHDIFNLKLPVELVVVSGCRTGLGKQIKGEGLIGFTRGFMYAGTERVIVSLWDVSDEASAKLMVRFYKGMLGKERLSPAAALRAAQIALWKEERWHAPYYWAAFVLQGEPQ
jgi:CHAT domain-containing protein/Tfp pilus assembly protein PilF